MKLTMTLFAESNPVCDFKSLERVSCPSVDMVGRKINVGAAFTALVLIALQYCLPPLGVLLPKSLSLEECSIPAFEVPMLLPAKFTSARYRASKPMAIGFCCDGLPAYGARQLYCPFAFIPCRFTQVRDPLSLSIYEGSLNANIPSSAFAFSKMDRAKPGDGQLLHPISYLPSAHAELFPNNLRGNSLIDVQPSNVGLRYCSHL